MFSHQDVRAEATFISLTTERGRTISATPGHYIVAADASGEASPKHHSPWTLVRAGDIAVGSCLQITAGDEQDACDRVAARSITVLRGLYNPHTASGSIVVDGFSAATFSDILPPSHSTHAAVTAPFRWLYGVCKAYDNIRACEALNGMILWPLKHLPDMHTALGKGWISLLHTSARSSPA